MNPDVSTAKSPRSREIAVLAVRGFALYQAAQRAHQIPPYVFIRFLMVFVIAAF